MDLTSVPVVFYLYWKVQVLKTSRGELLPPRGDERTTTLLSAFVIVQPAGSVSNVPL